MEIARVSVVFFSFLLCTYLSLLLKNQFTTDLVGKFRIVPRWMFLVSFSLCNILDQTFAWNPGSMHNV
ncbi:hypothetical protein B0H17DRAFT_1102470, partial [Mycena rosella]